MQASPVLHGQATIMLMFNLFFDIDATTLPVKLYSLIRAEGAFRICGTHPSVIWLSISGKFRPVLVLICTAEYVIELVSILFIRSS